MKNSGKTKSVRTQHPKRDFEEEFQDTEKRQPLILKVSKPIRKCKDMAVNRDITFQSCEITKSQNYIQYNEPITTDEGETTQDKDSDDGSYRTTSDSLGYSYEEETFDKDHPDKNLQSGTKLVVFWSCVVILLKVCRVSFQPVKICKVFQKGTKVTVDALYDSNHKYSWHSQLNENGRQLGTFRLPSQLFYLEELLRD